MPEEIESSVTPETMRDTIVNFAVESWRFCKVFDRMLSKIDVGEQGRYISQFKWFMKKIDESLEQSGMRIVNVEGHSFDPGVAATPINISEFGEKDNLIVEQMLEPIIMGNGGLVRSGIVTLRKVQL